MAATTRTIATFEVDVTYIGPSNYEQTIELTTQSADDVLLVLLIGDNDTGNGIEWNGSALTEQISQGDANTGGVQMWDLDAPDVGTYDLVLDWPGNIDGWRCVVLAVQEVGGRRGTPQSTAGYGTTMTDTITTVSGDLVVGVCTTESVATQDGSQTAITTNEQETGGGDEYGSTARKAATTTSTSLTWTTSAGNERWAVGLIAYTPSAGSPVASILQQH